MGTFCYRRGGQRPPEGPSGPWGPRVPQASAGARRRGVEHPELLVYINTVDIWIFGVCLFLYTPVNALLCQCTTDSTLVYHCTPVSCTLLVPCCVSKLLSVAHCVIMHFSIIKCVSTLMPIPFFVSRLLCVPDCVSKTHVSTILCQYTTICILLC